MSMDLDQSKPFTKEQRLWAHEWGLDHLIEENERRHEQRKVHDNGEPIDVRKALDNAGVEVPDAPPNPTYVGAQGGVQQGPLIVEGEDNAGRVPLPRDHPFTVPVEGEPESVADGEWDAKAVRAEVNSLNVDDLKENLRELEQPVSGSKEELQKRLYKALKESHEAEQTEESPSE
jgi:hypothetical protein